MTETALLLSYFHIAACMRPGRFATRTKMARESIIVINIIVIDINKASCSAVNNR